MLTQLVQLGKVVQSTMQRFSSASRPNGPLMRDPSELLEAYKAGMRQEASRGRHAVHVLRRKIFQFDDFFMFLQDHIVMSFIVVAALLLFALARLENSCGQVSHVVSRVRTRALIGFGPCVCCSARRQAGC